MMVRFRGALAMTMALLSVPALAQGRPGAQAARGGETAAFVVTLGNDTLAVEKFSRSASQLSGELVSRSPRTVTRSYTALLNRDGSLRRLEMTTRTAGSPEITTAVDFTADSAFTRVQRGDSVYTFRVAAPGAVPLINFSNVFYEQATLRARALRADSVTLTLVPVGSNQKFPMVVRRVGADSMHLANLAGVQRVAVDARGRLLGLDGRESTQKFIVTRVRDIDVDAFAAEFARRDAANQGIGTLSPRDSAAIDLGGAHLAIDYGRPFRRGRTIFGDVVPWGQVWRTGANAATGFTTSRDLVIGGATVPAGRYTLWTLPAREGWMLIVNRQTGQWGTEYHPEQDLVRIPMQTRTLATPVDAFTIRLDAEGPGSVLRLQWDTTEAYVPVAVK